ncbi:MAG: hypothetical protein CMO30_17395 [Tistrella sp.]|uniref:Uncharacterized protein n=1 Tax=Tistrella mobilis TaxID=171437 RepID=A0A162JKG2_9PROT|nr:MULTISPECIES: hypothetical protein [Tistrella]KYO49377.1 hypothetical protein AUP44_17680 [Tistrella mobilis]MAD36228.1 hypothetical protein [Tistrella sp.]MBA77046.1 hypothetical protein [Tistrella sp.]HAE49757.1 hypothetical protein [Tistrella mobilis]
MNRRALILGTASGLLYGGWAFFANHGAGMPAGLRAAAVQFLLSFGATAVLTLAMDAILARRLRAGAIVAAVVPISLLAVVFATAHALAGTPHVLATIAPSYGIGLVFCTVYVRARRAAVAREACPSPAGRQV